MGTIVEQWRARLPELDASPLLVLGRIQRLAALIDSLLRPPFAEAHLAPGDFDVLAALRRVPPHALSNGDLAQVTLVTPGAMTKRIDRLTAAGLVTRDRAPEDARGRVVMLTADGERLVDRLMTDHMANEATILSALDREERRQLAGLLGKLLASVEAGG